MRSCFGITILLMVLLLHTVVSSNLHASVDFINYGFSFDKIQVNCSYYDHPPYQVLKLNGESYTGQKVRAEAKGYHFSLINKTENLLVSNMKDVDIYFQYYPAKDIKYPSKKPHTVVNNRSVYIIPSKDENNRIVYEFRVFIPVIFGGYYEISQESFNKEIPCQLKQVVNSFWTAAASIWRTAS